MSFLILPARTARPLENRLPLLDTNSRVYIYHPRVPRGYGILEFCAFRSDPDSGVFGVPLGMVLDACFVVAGNQQGELHLKAPPHERVAGHESDQDGLLVPGRYRFVVVQAGGVLDYEYHLCGSFAAWVPPVEIPARWRGGEAAEAPRAPKTSDVSGAVKFADEVCIMTGAATALQASHLVPKSEAEWFAFHTEVLTGYGGDPAQDLTSVRNEVTLRADLNGQGFDLGIFLFAPYADRVVAVFAMAAGEDLAHKYHLRAVNLPTRIRRGYLFIRFVWDVFKFLSPGLASAAAMVRPLAERPDGDGFLKRKRADDTGSGSNKSKKGGIGGGGARNQEDLGGADSGGGGGGGGGGAEEDMGGASDGLTEDEESVPKTEDKDKDEPQLAVFEILDEGLKTRPLTVDDVEAGRYPGFSRIK